MNVRLAVILSGSLLVGAAGGLIAATPAIRAAMAVPAAERAPSPELEIRRRALMASFRSTADAVADRALQLELLAELMAEASRRPDRVSIEPRVVPVDAGW